VVKDHLTRIDQAAQQALKEMRLLVYQLGPSDSLEIGLVGALSRRLDAVENRTGIQAELNLAGKIDLEDSVEMVLYRIAEEALNNTLKHARATSVVVDIRAENGKICMIIEDNGCGFDIAGAQKGSGMGLTNMHDRAAALGGKLELISSPDQGTKVIVNIEE
jgi:signal transduction histidine kinase